MSSRGRAVILGVDGSERTPAGAHDLSQAVKELAALPRGAKAFVSVCAGGGHGTVALLENR